MRFQFLKFTKPIGAVRERRPDLARTTTRGAIEFCIAVVILAAMIVAQPLFAQTNTGSISGNVLDPQGNPIASAAVRVTNVQTGEVQARQSSSAGSYRIDALTPGKYTLSAEATGFMGYKADDVTVIISTTTP